MSLECRELILRRIREHGPITFAAFMDVALYHPTVGYYATASRRSGRAGDFFTSVDLGPAFGELLAERLAGMLRTVGGAGADGDRPLDLVEAGASDGRLSRDVLDGLLRHPDVYPRLRVHLVERSAAAREMQASVLARHRARLASSGAELPSSVEGVIFANELLDALPCHAVVSYGDGLREIVIDAVGDDLVEREAELSTRAIAEYFAELDVRPEPGFRTEVNLAATAWVGEAAAALRRGFVVLIDYGHDARTLFSASHSRGTLTTFSSHVAEAHEGDRQPPWLRDPGSRDITSHVNFTAVAAAARAAGLTPLSLVDQQRFLTEAGIDRLLEGSTGTERAALARRLAVKTLLMPGGLGSTHQVMVLGKNVV